MNAADFRRQMGADMLAGTTYDLSTPSSTETWVIVQPGKEHDGWVNHFGCVVKLVYRQGQLQRYDLLHDWKPNAWPRIVAELHNWPQ